MHLTTNDVREIAGCSRIDLSQDEVEKMCLELNNIIDSLKPITEYDLEGVEPTFHPIAGLINVMRADEVKTGFSQEEALAAAPATQDGHYKIPSILGGGGGSQ